MGFVIRSWILDRSDTTYPSDGSQPQPTVGQSQAIYDVDKNGHANDARICHSSRLCGDVRNASIVLPHVGACDAASCAADTGF